MAKNAQEMNALEIARKLAKLGQTKDACRAYALAAADTAQFTAEERIEAALFTLQFGEDYTIAYDAFLSIYRSGSFHEDLLPLMTEAFYLPNEQDMKKRYELNCRLLKKYPYCFRKDFLPFEELPLRFFPYDNKGYVPFDIENDSFGEYTDFNHQVISRNFFKDLENPILADDVFSQYELEYLRDNVRRSDWVARENHIYLHYTDWTVFCAYLQCLELREVLKEEKIVFLFEDEISRYPIDFKEEFGIDYSAFPVKPVGIREINRLIWHTQLSAHNGGDFFNEIFCGHPNLLMWDSIMLSSLRDTIACVKDGIKTLKKNGTGWNGLQITADGEKYPVTYDNPFFQSLCEIKNITDKDALVATFMAFFSMKNSLPDPQERITPILFMQPHFHNFTYKIDVHPTKYPTLTCDAVEEMLRSPFFDGFKYIKTFTPMRRPTTSYSASIRFMNSNRNLGKTEEEAKKPNRVRDPMGERITTRSYLIDPEERFFKDSRLVRFEDGKLNPKAVFTALAEFLDIPYTESMTYCSTFKGVIPDGFRTNSLYNTYDDFANDSERCYLEYLMRDAYEAYGYDFHYYDGSPMDEEKLKTLIADFGHVNSYAVYTKRPDGSDPLAPFELTAEEHEKFINESLRLISEFDIVRLQLGKVIGRLPTFVNKNGRPMKLMTPLKLDPSLLETELYH